VCESSIFDRTPPTSIRSSRRGLFRSSTFASTLRALRRCFVVSQDELVSTLQNAMSQLVCPLGLSGRFRRSTSRDSAALMSSNQYTDLVPGPYSGSDTQRRVGITKAGSARLRTCLIFNRPGLPVAAENRR
jgi:hypothetical protein